MELRYGLTDTGRRWAVEALEQCSYSGVAPIPLAEFQDRVQGQKITNERIDRDTLSQKFSDLIVNDTFLRRIGPAVNSGRAVLLYGPAGQRQDLDRRARQRHLRRHHLCAAGHRSGRSDHQGVRSRAA